MEFGLGRGGLKKRSHFRPKKTTFNEKQKVKKNPRFIIGESKNFRNRKTSQCSVDSNDRYTIETRENLDLH